MYVYVYVYTYIYICISGNMYFHVLYIHLEYGHVSVVFIITIVIIEVKMYLISKATTCSDNVYLTLVDSQNLSSARGRFSGSPQGGILGHMIVAEVCQTSLCYLCSIKPYKVHLDYTQV